MGRSTTTLPKWYDNARMVLFQRWRNWSLEDYQNLIQEIEEDRAERLRANLMMADHSFYEADWVLLLDPDLRSWHEFAYGQKRSMAVRKWLRDFWSGDPAIPIPRPRCLYLDNGKIRETDTKPVEINTSL